MPAGWWHVVLNVETSTAVSHALTLSRDLPRLLERARREAAAEGEVEPAAVRGVCKDAVPWEEQACTLAG